MSEAVVPRSFSEAAAALAAASEQSRPIRIVGGGTKLGWGGLTPPRALHLRMSQLSRVTIHEDRAFATINAGTPLARAQATLARSRLMLAIDPQLGLVRGPAATLGGVLATADSGPLSHGHGTPRDQLLGMTIARSNGEIVRTGPRTAGEQPGLDIAALFTGSFGTLGVILAVDVRLCPLPSGSATALATTDSPERLGAAVELIVHAHPHLEALDFAWHDRRGGLLARVGGAEADAQARAVAETMRGCGLQDATVRSDDAGLWARQRAGQRSAERALLRVEHHPQQLEGVVRAADDALATVVGRAALGQAYLTLDVPRIATARQALPAGASAIVLDLPASARGAVDPWNTPDGPALELMRELKHEFDPAGVCNPGIFVGSI